MAQDIKLFLSYRRKDDKDGFIEKLHRALEDGLKSERVFIDKKDLPKIGDFPQELKNAIDNCSVFLPFVTENYISFKDKSRDDWCREEIAYAISRNKTIVPVILDNVLADVVQIGDFNWQKQIRYEEVSNEDILKNLKAMQQSNVAAAVSSSMSAKETANAIISQVLNQYAVPLIDFLDMQERIIGSKSGVQAECLISLDEWQDFGISGKLTEKERLAEKKEKEWKEARLRNCSLEQFITRIEEERTAVVIGDAGQGKSVYLKKICDYFTQRIKDCKYSRDLTFPIYVQLKRLSESLNDIRELTKEEFLEAIEKSTNASKSIIEWLLRNGKACFLFDGMDEIPPVSFKKIHDGVCEYLNSGNTYIVFSSRPKQQFVANEFKDFDLGADNVVRRWVLDEISDQNLVTFLCNKFKNKTDDTGSLKETAEDRARDWYKAIIKKEGETNGYKALSRNPLTLNVILTISEGCNALPKSKVEVYDKAVDKLLERDDRKQAEGSLDYGDIVGVKKILGKYAYFSYRMQDGAKEPFKGIDRLIDSTFKRDESRAKRIRDFITDHTLVDENGFSHDLFQTYYCAFYIYELLCNNKEIGEEKLKEVANNVDKQYWAGVLEMLICLVEYYADPVDEDCGSIAEVLMSVLDIMQNDKTINGGLPNYDFLCGVVQQFVYDKNKVSGEKALISGMLKRGARGIFTFDNQSYTCGDGINPYEELFYYAVQYNMVCGLKAVRPSDLKAEIKDAENGKILLGQEDAFAIQSHLFNELVGVSGLELKVEEPMQSREFLINYIKAASVERAVVNEIQGHAVLSENCKYYRFIDKSTWHKFSMRSREFAQVRRVVYTNKLTSIIIADDNLPLAAFESSLSLKKVIIKEGVTSIGERAFSGCRSLESIVIPSSVTSIGCDAFAFCGSLTNIVIPGGVTSIRGGTFVGCDSLTSIVIPSGVTALGHSAFSDCNSLASVTFGGNSRLTSIESSVFLNCGSLTSIVIPQGVTSIGAYAFSGCNSLASIVIPSSVTSIGYFPFDEWCDSLVIYCEAKSKPRGWDSAWNYWNRPVVWGYKKKS